MKQNYSIGRRLAARLMREYAGAILQVTQQDLAEFVAKASQGRSLLGDWLVVEFSSDPGEIDGLERTEGDGVFATFRRSWPEDRPMSEVLNATPGYADKDGGTHAHRTVYREVLTNALGLIRFRAFPDLL